MANRNLLKFWAGWLAAGLMIAITGAWAFWGAAELYYEAWGLPIPEPLYYLIPGAITLALTLLALKWPRAGGWFIILLGATFTWFVLRRRIGQMGVADFLSWFPLTFLTLAVGALFVWGGRAAFHAQTASVSRPWWRRHLHYLLAVGVPALIIFGVSAWMLPRNLMRVDDGDRSARLIRGNGVALVWAPAGPGWNWRQPYGGYPSWDMLAWYGRPPVGMKTGDALPPGHATQAEMAATGLCRYLDASGERLMPEPQNIWRMPTTDELVRSLVFRGENAGCWWDGRAGRADCRHTPDKETPLWAPDQPPIYLWSGEEAGADEAWFVSYNGWVKKQPKSWGNPRHGYRCVRELR
jgi:hypothetical protein